MSKKQLFLTLNLQLFGEGAGESGDSGTGAQEATGENAIAAVSQLKGENNPEGQTLTAEGQATPPDRNAEFEKLIKGEYKDLYDARIKDTVQKRLKSTKETVEKYNALAPTLEMLSKKYGVDASDIEALNKAIEDDDAYYEEEALQKGVSVEQLKTIRKMERENAELKRQMQEQEVRENANKIYIKWLEQAEALKSVYPNFNLETELQNTRFVELLKSNIDVRTAFEVMHKDEIVGSAMQFTAQQTKQKVVNSIIANGARPTENGTGSQSSAVVKSDVSQLSNKDIDELLRRSKHGERITF